VLGAIMLEKGAFDSVIEILKPECFYVESHQRIYKSMQGLAQKSQPIDILTVVEELKFREELEMIGGPYYVTRLTNAVVSSANIEAHARIILQKFIQRELIRSAAKLSGMLTKTVQTCLIYWMTRKVSCSRSPTTIFEKLRQHRHRAGKNHPAY
jgi:replicative DNA helicase